MTPCAPENRVLHFIVGMRVRAGRCCFEAGSMYPNLSHWDAKLLNLLCGSTARPAFGETMFITRSDGKQSLETRLPKATYLFLKKSRIM